MKAWCALALCASLFCASEGRAESDFVPKVLSPSDVRTYRAAFAAEAAGQRSKAAGLVAKLTDKSLVGYLQQERLLHARRAKFAELKSWLQDYGELSGADAVFKLAAKRAPRGAGVPAPEPVHWRGFLGERADFGDTSLASDLGRQTGEKLRALERDGKPDAADALLRQVSRDANLPAGDADKLTAYVAAAYLAEAQDQSAAAVAEEAIARGAISAPQCHWVAGLAAYRMAQFENAARHFEAVSQADGAAARINSAGAFWAARSWMRAGHPERVVPLYERAAEMPDTFYGLLAAQVLGQDIAVQFRDPELDKTSFAALVKNEAAHRAVALSQLGRDQAVEDELARAFGEIPADLDPKFAALARALGSPALELRAAENATERDIVLTSLYPVPAYGPDGGFTLDRALVLAFARQESRFDANAVSPAGARGLMQLMPATAAIVAHDPTLAGRNKARLDDARYSLTLGQAYLGNLLERENGNMLALAAAYNGGAGNVPKWMAGREDDPLLFIETLPVPETRDYIKRVMMNLWMYRLRLGEPMTGAGEAASGAWPMYEKDSHG